MRHFTFLPARLIILLLMGSALWLGKDPLLRRAAIYYGQKATSAKVEIGHLQADLKQNRVLLKNIRFADPRNPMTNLFQADVAYLKLDPGQLWQKKFLVSEGKVHGLIVNAPRTESGALNAAAVQDHSAVAGQAEMMSRASIKSASALERVSQEWINKIDISSTPMIAKSDGESQTVQRLSRWRSSLAAYTAQAAEFGPLLNNLVTNLGLDQQFPNPLRDKKRVAGSLDDLEMLQSRAAELHREVATCLAGLDKGIAEIQELLDREIAQIQPGKPANQFDKALVSELLLTQDGHELVADIVNWLVWFRRTVPEQPSTERGTTARGTDIDLEGAVALPSFVISSVELEGSGWFARQHLNFVGTACNLSAQPHLQAEPTRIDLRALGRGNLLINCVVDRRNNQQLDRLRIQFPDLEFSPRQVGHEKSMLVTFGNGRRASADISLEIDRNDIRGNIILRFSRPALHVDSLSSLAGGDDTRLRINQALNGLGQFKVHLAISGTLEEYQVQLDSDLGQQFVEIVDNAVIARMTLQNQRLLESLQQQRKQAEHVIEAEIRPGLQQLLNSLDGASQRIADLRSDVEGAEKSGWSRLR
jgi:uncharacterized protein (TIGR03545 family)